MERAKAFAAKHGYKLRKMPHSAKEPNAWVKVIAPDGKELRATDWSQALQMMMHGSYRK
ncbi:hypothetical protein D3C75_710970 [compost metagenome]